MEMTKNFFLGGEGEGVKDTYIKLEFFRVSRLELRSLERCKKENSFISGNQITFLCYAG